MTQDDAPKLHVDMDWKAEAQAEKERLSREEAAKQAKAKTAAPSGPAATGPDGRPALPEASFQTLVGMLASQALMGLGTMQDPRSGEVIVDLEGSRLSIDLLGVLEEKTKGNLDEAEEGELTQLTAELRSRYVEVSQYIVEQAKAGKVRTTPHPPTP